MAQAKAAKEKPARAQASQPREAEAQAVQTKLPKNYVPRLKKLYREKVVQELFEELGYSSKMQVLARKVIVSMGVGEARGE